MATKTIHYADSSKITPTGWTVGRTPGGAFGTIDYSTSESDAVSFPAFSVETTPELRIALGALVVTGLFGTTLAEVALELLQRGVREAIKDGHIPKPDRNAFWSPKVKRGKKTKRAK